MNKEKRFYYFYIKDITESISVNSAHGTSFSNAESCSNGSTGGGIWTAGLAFSYSIFGLEGIDGAKMTPVAREEV